MRNSVLPVMAVLTVISGAVGLQLGESAIGQIDPLYFQGAPPPARDVTLNRRPAPANAYASAYGWAEGYQALDADCADCPALLVRNSYAQPAEPLYAYSDPTIEPRWEQAEALFAEETLPLTQTESASRVQRYLHYPVSADQAEIRAGLDGAEEPAADEPAGL